MAGLAHVAVGVMAGRLYGGRNQPQRLAAMAGFAALSLLPDLDLVPVFLGAPDHGLGGHRGITHTLAFAAILALVIGFCAHRLQRNVVAAATLAFLTLASHGVLDAFTADTRGIPLLWPFSAERFCAPFRPIPDAPTGLAFLSWRGLQGSLVEVAFFLPIVVFALWPRPLKQGQGYRGLVTSTLLLVLAISSCLTIAQVLLDHVPVVAHAWHRVLRS